MPFPFADKSAEPLADLFSLSGRSVRLDASVVMPVMAQSLIGRTGTHRITLPAWCCSARATYQPS